MRPFYLWPAMGLVVVAWAMGVSGPELFLLSVALGLFAGFFDANRRRR